MAQIKQVGIGRKSSGTIDGITYYTRNGKTFARSAPTMPASAYSNPEAKVRQAIFMMVQMHMKYHLRTIRQTITGVEQAISDYAAEHPNSIKIASKSGYQEVYLTGPWPSTITLNALSGDSTVIIIVNEYGVQTTIKADGTTTVSTYSGSDNGNANDNQNGGGSSTPSTGSGSGSDDSGSGTGTGSDTGGSGSGSNTGGGSSTGSENGGDNSGGGNTSGDGGGGDGYTD